MLVSDGNRLAAARVRVPSIDVLRGAVMVLMALDHARDFYSNAGVNPTDLAHTTSALFLTRWVTHFCAPVFVFLAGTSAYLQLSTGKTRRELARFLFTRGLWLVVLEATWNNFMWRLDPGEHFVMFQVLWAIGVAMVALAALVRLGLSTATIAAIGLAIVAGHNLLDGRLGTRDTASLAARILEVGGTTPLPGGRRLFFAYPVVAWIGVMATGFGFGTLVARPAPARARAVALVGAGALALFVVLRATGLYGDASPFAHQSSAAFTVWSFLDTTKYPPSLEYLGMTLGPALLVLAAVDGVASPRGVLAVYGRTPMFFYLLHVPLLSVSSALVHWARLGRFGFPGFGNNPRTIPIADGAGFALPWVYVAWIAVVVALYWPCRAWGELKRRHPERRWLSYL